MPIDPSRPPKPSWRDPVKPNDRKPQAQRDWRKEPATTKPTGKRWTRKRRFALAFIAFLLCGIGLIAVIAMWHQPKGAALVLLGAGYENNLAIPHNAYGMNGLNDLAAIAKKGPPPSRWSWSDTGDLRLGHGPQTLGVDEPWTKGWDDIDQETVVIFLALHGATDTKGAYLLLDDPTGQKPPLYVANVLKDLAKLRSKNIVLILDATQAADNWSLGMLHNDFVRQLVAMNPNVAGKNLVILHASDEGQRSWVSEEWRQTIFTHYVIEGLKGGMPGKSRITVKDLFDYVKKEVENWVKGNRAALQTPILIDPNNRADKIELDAIRNAYSPPKPEEAPGHEFTISKDLKDAWGEYEDLAGDKHGFSPAFHSPHLWRLYGETLLRYEQLLRAGYPAGKAAGLEKDLTHLQDQLLKAERDLQNKLPCVNNALPLAQTFGLKPLPDDPVKKQFSKLWNAEEDARAGRWEDALTWAKENDSKDNRKDSEDLLRVRFGQLLLGQAIEDENEESLAKAHKLARLVHEGRNLHPVELHFLALLDRDLAAPRRDTASLVRRALSLQRLAEQAALAVPPLGARTATSSHPYSEWIYPWIVNNVKLADEQRRFGNDLLISSHKADRDKANGEYFKNAEDLYQKAAEDAKAVRDALTARDQAFAELPVYTRWLGSRDRLDDVLDADIDALEKLWTSTHLLADALDPADAAKSGPRRREDLEKSTGAVRQGLAAQQTKYRDACKKNATRNEQLPRTWREIEELLSVPILPAVDKGSSVRMALLENSRKVSDGLNTNYYAPGSNNPVPVLTLPPDDRARRQGRLVLAVLGEAWVNRLADEPQKSVLKYDDLHKLITQSGGDWETRLNRAGEQVGECSRLLPKRVQERLDESLTGDAKQAQPKLHEADRLARQVDAAGAARLTGNPADEYRRLRLQGLLLWLADRTVHDHWWSEKDGEDPFYMFAGQAYVTDSKQTALGGLVGGLTSDTKRNKRIQTELAGQLEAQLVKQGLEVAELLDGSWTLTSDPTIRLRYRVKAPLALNPGLPGFPLARFTPDKDKRLKLENAEMEGWTVVDVDAFSEQKPERIREYRAWLDDKDTSDKPLATTPEFLYRGQRIPINTSIKVYRKPDTIVRQYEVPNTGAFTARVDEDAYQGSLVIVLDISGSMLTGDGNKQLTEAEYKNGGSCRFRRALNSLEQVLPTIPEGTQVTVLAFGHKDGEVPYEEFFNEPWRRANKKQFTELMKKLKRQIPEGWSPIMNTLVKAQERYLKNAEGAKTILVLTDGLDNEFVGGRVRDTDPAKTNELLKDTFGKVSTVVNVVFFEISHETIGGKKSEQQIALEQFEALEHLPRKRGKLFEVQPVVKDDKKINDDETSKALTKKIAEALRPRYWVQFGDTGNNVEGIPEEGLPTSFVSEPGLIWVPGLKAQVYDVVLPNGDVAKIQIEPGDRLATTIKAVDGRIVLQRMLYYEYEKARGKILPDPVQAGAWQLAVIQNARIKKQMDQDRLLQMTVAVEDVQTRTVSKGSLHVFNPRFIWLEVTAQDSDKPLRVNWGNLTGYPAAAWTLEAPDWSSLKPESKPRLNAWVLSDQDPKPAASAHHVAGKELENEFQDPLGFDDQVVRIESVSFKPEREVEYEPDKKGKRDCLVVQLRHSPKHPVMIKLGGVRPTGAEHYFYNDAAKYTAVFWGVTEKQLIANPNFSLDVISIDGVKKAGAPVEIKLKAPAEEGQRPGRP